MRPWEENIAALRAAVRTGVAVSLVATAGVAVFFLLTLDRPDRTLLLLLDGLAALVAGAAALLPLEAMARRRLIAPFFVLWSGSLIAIVAAVVAAENDPASPFVAFFFLPLVFASIAYPLRLVLIVSALDVAALVLTLTVALERDAADVFLWTVAVLAAAGLCVSQARTKDRHLAEVARLSRTDPLTDTLNRRGFEEELSERMARLARYGTPVGLVLLDLDGFKAVNDREGHAAGDDLLRRVGEAIVRTVRATDATSRVGGDEFAVLLEQSDGITAPIVAERILTAVAPYSAATTGCASCPEDADTAEELYRLADGRLYEGKAAGASVRGAARG